MQYAQSPPLSRLSQAIERLAKDPAMRSASWGVAVVDVRTGQLLASHDPHRSLTTASTMKAITTATALEVLGPDFRFETVLAYDGEIKDSVLNGNLYLIGDGDPTLGSDRLGEAYSLESVLAAWVAAIKQAGISRVAGAVVGDASLFSTQMTPAKWPWEDMGNYYGAGSAGLNIHENYYRLDFRSKRPGTRTDVLRTVPAMDNLTFVNEVLAGPSGSGDNAYIYGAPYTPLRYLRGTIPPNRSSFSIKGSVSDPPLTAATWLREELLNCGISVYGEPITQRQLWATGEIPMMERTALHTLRSAPLSEIVEATNMRSINLYAEALAKRLAVKLDREGSTVDAVEAIEAHWRKRGVDLRGITLRDGSGLSPGNGVSALQMAHILAKAAQGSGKEALYASLPVAGRSGTLSGMLKGTAAEGILRAKSGFISGVRAYTGYVDIKEGQRVAFAMIANHYNCSAGAMRSKLEVLMAALADGR